MNPLVLIGIGAVALIAMGGKKKPKSDAGPEDDDAGGGMTPLLAKKSKITPAKKAAIAKFPPLDYHAQINSKGQDIAQQCMNQGHKEEMDLTMCVAAKLFPDWDWDNRTGWMTDAWPRIRSVARVKLGLDPLGT